MSNQPNEPVPGIDPIDERQAPLTPEARTAARDVPPTEALDPATEKDLWEGRPSWKSIYPVLLVWVLIGAAATIAAGAWVRKESVTWTIVAVFGVILIAMLVRTGWGIWSISYRLTSQRLFVRRGILSQTVDQTELLRVDDVRTRQTLVQRMLGIGEVEMLTSDNSDKKLVIRDVEDPMTLAEHVRRHTRMVQRRTVFMEQL